MADLLSDRVEDEVLHRGGDPAGQQPDRARGDRRAAVQARRRAADRRDPRRCLAAARPAGGRAAGRRPGGAAHPDDRASEPAEQQGTQARRSGLGGRDHDGRGADHAGLQDGRPHAGRRCGCGDAMASIRWPCTGATRTSAGNSTTWWCGSATRCCWKARPADIQRLAAEMDMVDVSHPSARAFRRGHAPDRDRRAGGHRGAGGAERGADPAAGGDRGGAGAGHRLHRRRRGVFLRRRAAAGADLRDAGGRRRRWNTPARSR